MLGRRQNAIKRRLQQIDSLLSRGKAAQFPLRVKQNNVSVEGAESGLQERMGNGVVHNRTSVTGERRAIQLVRLEKRSGLLGVVGLF